MQAPEFSIKIVAIFFNLHLICEKVQDNGIATDLFQAEDTKEEERAKACKSGQASPLDRGPGEALRVRAGRRRDGAVAEAQLSPKSISVLSPIFRLLLSPFTSVSLPIND